MHSTVTNPIQRKSFFIDSSHSVKVVDGTIELMPRKTPCPLKCLYGTCQRGTSISVKVQHKL